MAFFQENEDLIQVEKDTESRVMEMKRQLELGQEELVAEFHGSSSELRETTRQAIEKIEELAAESSEELQRVQQSLGEINYLLAEEKLENPSMLDEWRDQIVSRMEEARDFLARMEDRAQRELGDSGAELEKVWKTFLARLELVRLRLAETEQDTAQKFREERRHLLERLDQETRDPGPLERFKAKVGDGIEAHKRWVIAFFQSPLEATPHPPAPDYASTDPDPDDEAGTGA